MPLSSGEWPEKIRTHECGPCKVCEASFPVSCSTKLHTFVLVALCFVHFGCKEARDEMGIRSGKTRYEKWLVAQKPFLTNVPPAAIYEYEFTTIQEGSTIRPIVDYHIKAGDWDGLL